MAHHVFAWLSGFGWTVMPFAPFRIERTIGSDRSVMVRHDGIWGPGRAEVTIAEDGGAYSRRGRGLTIFPSRVVSVFPGVARPHFPQIGPEDHWRVECEFLSFRWPEGFSLESTPDFPPAFEMLSGHSSRIWLQGPLERELLPTLSEMRTEDQAVVEQSHSGGSDLVELAYLHEGDPWRMFHAVVPLGTGHSVIVSAQALESERDLLRSGVGTVAESIRFHPPPPEPA